MIARADRFVLVLAALVGVAMACTSTKILDAWEDPERPAPGFRSVGVIGLAERPAMREYHERHFVERLQAKGVRAVASQPGLPDLSKLGRETVQAWARDAGVEAVVTTRLVDMQKETWSVPTSPGNFYLDPSSRYGDDVEAAAVTYHLETRLYEVATGRELFRARTESVRPVSPHSVVLSVIGALVDELTMRGLVRPAES